MILITIIVVIILLVMLYIYLNKAYGGPYKINFKSKPMTLSYNTNLKDFEKRMQQWYPLGDNEFKIEHGENYYKFFEKQEPLDINMQIFTEKKTNNIIGVGCGLLKYISNNNKIKEKCWYICDLKVDPKYRGKWIPFQMLLHTFIPSYLQSNRCYGVIMNKPKNVPNKSLNLSKKIKIGTFGLESAGLLYIYSIDYNQMLTLEPIISQYRKGISYVSLEGTKDLILKNDPNPMNILHLTYDNNKSYIELPIAGYTYMFCCYEKDKLKSVLDEYGITTDVTATIVHANMENYNWQFIETHQI